MPLEFWPQAFQAAGYLLNKVEGQHLVYSWDIDLIKVLIFCLDIESNRVYVSRHVLIEKFSFFYKKNASLSLARELCTDLPVTKIIRKIPSKTLHTGSRSPQPSPRVIDHLAQALLSPNFIVTGVSRSATSSHGKDKVNTPSIKLSSPYGSTLIL